MKRINILHLIYSLEMGGAEKVIYHYVDVLKKDAIFNPLVCAIKKRGPIADEIAKLGVKIFDLQSPYKIFSFFKLIRLILRENIRIIHAHNPVPNIFGVPAAFLTGLRKVIRTEHNIFYDGRVSCYYPLLNAFLGLYNYRIITVSDMVRVTHQRKDPLSRKKYVTVYNGIKKPNKHYMIDKSRYYRLFKINQDSRIIGNIASLTEQKDHGNFIEMVEILLREFNNLYFLIIGDGPLRSKLVETITSKGLKNRVILTGIRTDIPDLLEFIDVFVLSSLWEGFPMTVIEAMAAGKPVVVTDVGGNREAVLDGLTGYLVPPSNPEALAMAVKKLLQDESKAERMGRKGRKRFEQEFLAEVMVDRTRELYKAALGMS